MRRRPLTPGEHQPAQILADLAESRTSAWWQVSWLPDHPTPGPSHTADPSPAIVLRRPTAADRYLRAVASRFCPRLQWRGPRRLLTGFPLDPSPADTPSPRVTTTPELSKKRCRAT